MPIEVTTLVDIARQRAERQPDDEAFTFLARGNAGEECLALSLIHI